MGLFDKLLGIDSRVSSNKQIFTGNNNINGNVTTTNVTNNNTYHNQTIDSLEERNVPNKKEIIRVLFRSLDKKEQEFTEIKIADNGNTFNISDRDTNAGMLWDCKLRLILDQPRFSKIDGLEFLIVFSNNMYIIIGHKDMPAFMKTSEDLKGDVLSVDWSYWIEPKYMPISDTIFDLLKNNIS